MLKSTSPDLSAITELVAGAADDSSEAVALLSLSTLDAPPRDSVDEAAERLRRAADRLGALATTETRSADRVAGLLRAVLQHDDGHGSAPCPVCLTGTLNDDWRTEATRRAAQLEDAAAALRAAGGELSAARAAARELTRHRPPVLDSPAPVGIEPLRQAWFAWQDAGRTDEPAALAHALHTAHGPLAAAVEDARNRASAHLAHRDQVWAPLARQLGAWHEDATAAAAAEPTLGLLTRATKWLADTSDSRLAPFANASQRIWQALRQQSSVDLGPVRLDGSGSVRHVALDVRIDGTDGGTALGVMSQGELHALGLSLFLPRATVEQSPIRFVIIDDPVQAMARPRSTGSPACWRTSLPTARSWCSPTTTDSPMPCAGSRSPPPCGRCSEASAPRSSYGTMRCRSAVEAVCHAKIRRTRLGRGERHAAVERLISEARTTNHQATVAVFDDPTRGSDVLAKIRSEQGARGRGAAALQAGGSPRSQQ